MTRSTDVGGVLQFTTGTGLVGRWEVITLPISEKARQKGWAGNAHLRSLEESEGEREIKKKKKALRVFVF